MPALRHRCHQDIRTKHVLIFDIPRGGIFRIIVEQRPHDRRPFLMCLTHQVTDVGAHIFTDPDISLQDLLHIFAIAPDLIRCSGHTGSSAGGAVLRLIGHPVSMKAHDRAEGSVLKPPHQQFMECGIGAVSSEESADVRRPPGDSGDRHIQTGLDLTAHARETGLDVAGPHESAVTLAACPRTAKKIDDILHPFVLHSVEKALRVHHRVDVPDFQVGPPEVAVVLKIIDRIFRFCFVQPEDPDPFIEVVLSDLVPDIFPCFRVGCVKMNCISHVQAVDPDALLYSREKATGFHFLIVLTQEINHRPDGNHQLDPHLFQFTDHSVRIRPVGLVESPVSLLWPVEEVSNNDIQRDISSLVFPCHFQQFLLRLVTQLALPEAQSVLGHHGDCSRHPGVGFLDHGRRVTRTDPVIQFFRGIGLPGRQVLCEIHSADRGIVPEETVSE